MISRTTSQQVPAAKPDAKFNRAATAPHDCRPFLDEPTVAAAVPAHELEDLEISDGAVPSSTPTHGSRRIAHTLRRGSSADQARIPTPPRTPKISAQRERIHRAETTVADPPVVVNEPKTLLADGSNARRAPTSNDGPSVLGDDLLHAITTSPIGKITFDFEPDDRKPREPAAPPLPDPDPIALVRAPRNTHMLVGLAILIVALSTGAFLVATMFP